MELREKTIESFQNEINLLQLKIEESDKLKKEEMQKHKQQIEEIELALVHKEKHMLINLFKNYLNLYKSIKQKEAKVGELDKAIENRKDVLMK